MPRHIPTHVKESAIERFYALGAEGWDFHFDRASWVSRLFDVGRSSLLRWMRSGVAPAPTNTVTFRHDKPYWMHTAKWVAEEKGYEVRRHGDTLCWEEECSIDERRKR